MMDNTQPARKEASMLEHPHYHWQDFATFVGLIVAVALAFSVLVWPHTTAQAADSFAHMLKGLQLMLRGR